MTLVEFARQVEQMRALQREWYKTPAKDRRVAQLERAKASERAVDRALRAVLDGPEPDLFGSGEEDQ